MRSGQSLVFARFAHEHPVMCGVMPLSAHALRKTGRAASALGWLCLAYALFMPHAAHAQVVRSAAALSSGPVATFVEDDIEPSNSLDWERPDVKPPARETVWYGWQTLSVDGAAAALIVAQVATEITPAVFAIGGVATYLLGSPIVLLMHENPWSSASVVLRLASAGLTIGGAAVALGGGCFVIFGDEPEGCDARQAVGGVMIVTGLLAIPTAVVLDAVFARHKQATARSPSISMWADPTHASLGLSVAIQR